MIRPSYKTIVRVLSLVTSLVIYPISIHAVDEPEEGDISRGSQEWANNCARCHNMRDTKEFRDDLWEPIVTHMRVRAGLTGQQARDILVFLQSSNFTAAPSAAVSSSVTGLSGEQIYKQTCVACHGTDGKGAIPGVPDLRTRLSKSDETLLQNIESGVQSPGSPMAMPPKGGNPDLTPADLKLVLEYLRAKIK